MPVQAARRREFALEITSRAQLFVDFGPKNREKGHVDREFTALALEKTARRVRIERLHPGPVG